jgi:hypothetical protein
LHTAFSSMQKMVRRAASLVALASLLYVASAAVLPFHARGNVCVVSVADLCSCVCLSLARLRINACFSKAPLSRPVSMDDTHRI